MGIGLGGMLALCDRLQQASSYGADAAPGSRRGWPGCVRCDVRRSVFSAVPSRVVGFLSWGRQLGCSSLVLAGAWGPIPCRAASVVSERLSLQRGWVGLALCSALRRDSAARAPIRPLDGLHSVIAPDTGIVCLLSSSVSLLYNCKPSQGRDCPCNAAALFLICGAAAATVAPVSTTVCISPCCARSAPARQSTQRLCSRGCSVEMAVPLAPGSRRPSRRRCPSRCVASPTYSIAARQM